MRMIMIYAFIAFSVLVIVVLIIIFRMMNEMKSDFNHKLLKYKIDTFSEITSGNIKTMESHAKELKDIIEELKRLYIECDELSSTVNDLKNGKSIVVGRLNDLDDKIRSFYEELKRDISALRGRNELTERGYERVNSDIFYLIRMIDALARVDEVKEAYRHDTIRDVSTKLFGNTNFIEDNWDLLYKNYCEEINEDDDEEDQ